MTQSRRNQLDYALNHSAHADVLAQLEFELSGTEIRDIEHQRELMRRDINGAEHQFSPGVYQDVASVTSRGRRSGTRTYIQETIQEGYPLTLSTHSLATRVLFTKGRTPIAYGVEYMVGESLYAADQRYDPDQTGELRTVRAKKEVILAAGTFNTPQILKLSGIGPREELEQWDIPVLVDLPAVVSCPFTLHVTSIDSDRFRAQTFKTIPKAFSQLMLLHHGPRTTSLGAP